MDEMVVAAMAKWPQVPHCYGWLGLDARGRWWMRDDRAQRAGPFAGASATPESRGSELKHDKLRAFIHRNYAGDSAGQWYFQNGPQRVYVELERAPWVWRVDEFGGIQSHTGHPASWRAAVMDEMGWLYLETDLGWGVVHSQDMHCAAECVEAGVWRVQEAPFTEIQRRGGYVLSPLSAHQDGGRP